MFARGHFEQPIGRRHRCCVWPWIPPLPWRSELNLSLGHLSRLCSEAVSSVNEKTTTSLKGVLLFCVSREFKSPGIVVTYLDTF